MFNKMPLEGRVPQTSLETESMQHFIVLTSEESGKT